MENIYWDIIKNVAGETAVSEHKAIKVWSKIVGERISNVTNPVNIISGRLIVKVKNSVWRNELVMLKQDILIKYKNEFKSEIISDIKFL